MMRNGPDRITLQVKTTERTPTGGTITVWTDVEGPPIPAWVHLISVEEIGGERAGFYGESVTTSARVPLHTALPEGDKRVNVTTATPGMGGVYRVVSVRPSRSHLRLLITRTL